ncbi:MAG: CinA family protein [Ruminococcaceae bacterium]|nr:CinA family protein [Oscillospiraceae bacterium]
MVESELIALGEKVVKKFKEEKLTLSFAESCTGGWLSKIITEISGASEIFMGGVCSYSNEVKQNVLGVKEETLKLHGAVSEETAREMSEGITKIMKTSVGVGVTGIAGPLSDNTQKKVGLIYISITHNNKTDVIKLENDFSGDVRYKNRFTALKTVLSFLINEEL